MPEKQILKEFQALPLSQKIVKSQLRIAEWYEHFNGKVYVSFSGGKDSTVLAHLVNELYPEVPLVFSNTGLEYPEIQSFARKMGAQFIRPNMQFSEVISKYGYPIISKENAEAIYYARRIRNGEGGRAQQQKESEPNSKDSDPGINPAWGGGETYRRRADITNERNSWDRTRHVHGGQETARRNLLMGGNGRVRKAGVGGKHGEETASPG